MSTNRGAGHPGNEAHTVKGPGLARGPALIVGTILTVAGLALFLHAGDTSTSGFPDGDATGSKILGFESNGWTAWITTAAGALLLFGAAQHLLAKAMSLIVGLGLAACAVIALIDGDVLGLAAANWAVELAWGIAAVILLLNLFAPRIKRTEAVAGHDADEHARHRRPHADSEDGRPADEHPQADERRGTDDRPQTEDRLPTDERRASGEGRPSTDAGHDPRAADRPDPADARSEGRGRGPGPGLDG